MLTVAFGESNLSKKSVYKWYKLFIEGREYVNNDTRSGRPSSSTTDENIEAVNKIVMENRRITIREVAENVEISVGSCNAIFSDVLGMKHLAAKLNRLMTIAQELLNDVNDEQNLLKRVITDDETWVYAYDIETKPQSSKWKWPEEP